MPVFTVRAFFVCHDARLSDQAVVTVVQDEPPTEAEAGQLILAEAEAVVQRRMGDSGYQVELQQIHIEPADD